MTSSQPPALSYAVPGRKLSFFAMYLLYFLMIAVPMAGAAWMVFDLIPSFEDVFKDFRTTLPYPSLLVISIASHFRLPLIWPLGVIALLGCPWFLAKWTARYQRPVERLLVTLIALVVILFVSLAAWVLVQLLLFLPFMRLMQSLSGGT